MRGARRLLAGLLSLALVAGRVEAAAFVEVAAGAESSAARPVAPLPAPLALATPALNALPTLAASAPLTAAPAVPAFAAGAPAAAAATAPNIYAAAAVAAAPAAVPVAAAENAAPGDASRPATREFFAANGAARGADLAAAVRAHALARGFQFSAPAADDSGAAAADMFSFPAAAPAATPAAAPLPAPLRATLVNQGLVSAGVESLGLAVTQIARERFGDGALGPLSSASSVAMGVGSLAGGHAVERYGPERVYVATLALRAVAVGAMGALFAGGALSLPALIGLFSLDYALHSANYVALDALAPRLLGSAPAALNRYGQLRQIVVDSLGFAGPIGAGLLVASLGYAPIFWAYPALFVAAAAAGWLVLARRPRGAPAAPRAPREPGVGWGEAARELVRDPALRAAVAGYALMNVIGMSVYFIFGPAFGAYAADASGGSAAQIASVTTGLFAGGGLFGLLALPRVLGTNGPRAPAAGAVARRIAAALALTAVALLGVSSMLYVVPLGHLALFGLSVPVFAGQLAMLPLGAIFTVPLIGLLSVIQARASARARAKALGFNRFAAMAASFVFSELLGAMLTRLAPSGRAGFPAFVGLAAAAAVLAVGALAVAFELRRASRAGGEK